MGALPDFAAQGTQAMTVEGVASWNERAAFAHPAFPAPPALFVAG